MPTDIECICIGYHGYVAGKLRTYNFSSRDSKEEGIFTMTQTDKAIWSYGDCKAESMLIKLRININQIFKDNRVQISEHQWNDYGISS